MRLPDRDSLGARPVPQSRASVASNPRVGAVAGAIADVGEMFSKIGAEKFAARDRLEYEAARSMVLKADVEARREFADDPDYGSFEKRYGERMAAARKAAGETLSNHADRAVFSQESEADFQRGRSEVLQTASARRTTARKAALYNGLQRLQETGRDAPDDDTRVATVKTAGMLIKGGQEDGTLDALAASQLRRDWTGNYLGNQVTMALNQEDPDTARALLAQRGYMIPAEQRTQLEARLKGVTDFRLSKDRAAWAVRGDGDIGDAPAKPNPDSKWSVISRPGAPRDGGARRHAGYDIAPTKGHEGWYPAQDFRIENPHNGGAKAGLMATVVFANGDRLKLMHLASLPTAGEYKAGELAAVAGNTGNAKNTPTHFHTEGSDAQGNRIDPTKYFTGGSGGGSGGPQQGARRHDLGAALARVDERADREGWTPEMRERVKDDVRQEIGTDELIASREEQAHKRSALDTAEKLGDNFTDVSQIPNYESLAPDDKLQLRGMADQNKRARAGATVAADGDIYNSMVVLKNRDPENFIDTDLRAVRPFMRPNEFSGLIADQAEMRTKAGWKPDGTRGAPTVNPLGNVRGQIDSAISYHTKHDGYEIDLNTKDGRRMYARMSGLMRNFIDRRTEGKRAPTDDDFRDAYAYATMQVTVVRPGMLWDSEEKVPLFRVEEGGKARYDIPSDIRTRIIASLARNGVKNPTAQQIADMYVAGKGRLW